jgi:gamma-glutamyltranspeptidase/glutathione hydrolase
MNARPIIIKISCGIALMLHACSPTENPPYSNNVVAAAHPLASKAGTAMYAQGGNAFDAAIAAAFTLAVVEPSMSGIGGRLQAIYQTKKGVIGGVDATTEVPQSYQHTEDKFPYGYRTIGIPGVVAGLIKLHEDHGSLPLATLMTPAITHAEKGFKILPGEALRQEKAAPILAQFEGSRHHFLKADSTALNAGELLIQKDLAKVLKEIAQKGAAGFYQGAVAEKIVADMEAHGGILSLEDLKKYTARSSRVVEGQFQGHKIHSLYLPSYGAITLQILQILDHLKPSETEEEWATQLGSATEIAYEYRGHQENQDSLSAILSYEKAAQWAQQIQKEEEQRLASIPHSTPISWTSIDGHTTHLTTADQWGNTVALTQTVGPNMGSKVATKGLGFLYAVTLGGYLGAYNPGDRVNSHISPTLVTKDGVLQVALGAAGGSRIVTAITQVLSRYLAQKHPLEKALLLPRVYPYEDSLWIENHPEVAPLNATFDPSQTPVKYIDEIARFGRVHAIAKDPNASQWIGAADPDWEGTTEYKTN